MQIHFGLFRLDVDTRQLLRDGLPIRLTPKAFELLLLLVENRPKAVSKAQLSERIWPGVFVSEEGLARLVNEVRRALGDNARDPSWVRTLHGFGYAFAPDEQALPLHVCRVAWANREIHLGEGEHIIGRDPQASVRLKASVISRRHARIVVQDTGATLEDLRSKNGTFVGETRLTGPHPLSDGDEIHVGDFTLTFRAPVAPSTLTYPQ